MSDIARPRFRIHRLDAPFESGSVKSDVHYRAFWQVDGKVFRVQVWSQTEWERLAPTGHPSGARSLDGRGWMVLQPFDGE